MGNDSRSPMTTAIYAIGDIHGDLSQLRNAHGKIVADVMDRKVESHRIVHVGDLVDRREDSKGVIDYLIAGHKEGAPWVTLKGNHDRLFQWFMEDPFRADARLRADYSWLHPRMGGRDTLASYGVLVEEGFDLTDLHNKALKAVPKTHLEFLTSLPLSFETEHFFFCHAGIRPGIALGEQTEDDLVWIRNEFLNDPVVHPKIIVHGHSPADDVEYTGNRINVDTGAAYGRKLSTVVLDGLDVFVLGDEGRTPLVPHD